MCWYKANRQRGKKKQTICLYNFVPTTPSSICFAVDGIYGPPAECNKWGWVECNTQLHSPCTRGQTPKILARNFFVCWAVWILWVIFFFWTSNWFLPFVREKYCNCVSRGKFHANEFLKWAYKIDESSPHKRFLSARYQMQICMKADIEVICQKTPSAKTSFFSWWPHYQRRSKIESARYWMQHL
jgi:hypothetical protein